MTDAQRFVMLGTGGNFTYQVMKSLLERCCIPAAYIQSGADATTPTASFAGIELEISRQQRLSDLMRQHDIPCHYHPGQQLAELIARYRAQFLLVACWPGLLPATVLNAVSEAPLNLHPSLLPSYRGVDPIGEQLKAQDHDFGVTLHLLNEHFDRGDIVLQQRVSVAQLTPDGVEKATASAGAGLFIRALQDYRHPGWCLVKQA